MDDGLLDIATCSIVQVDRRFIMWAIYRPDDGGIKYLRNVGGISQKYVVSLGTTACNESVSCE